MFAVPSFFGYNTTFVNTPVATAATGVGETSFTANWNAFSGASYYLLDVSLSSSFSSFVLQDTVTTATSYVVTGLTASTTYYYRIRAAINVDSDVAGFVSRVYTAGGTLSYTEVTATETLVADLKGYGIWTAMKAIYPMVGASAAACAQNLVSSSFTGTFSSGFTFASTGVTGNGSSAYMNTGFSADTNQTVNNCSVSVYVRTATAAAGSVGELGATISPTFLPLIAFQSTGTTTRNQYCWDYNTGQGAVNLTTTDNSGMWGVSRSGSNSWQSFERNTAVAKTTTTSQSSLPTANIYIGAVNDNGTAVNFSFRQIAFSHMGDALSNTQFANFYTAVQTFNQTLNRQVGAQIVSDADAQAYIDRVYTAGGTLTNTEANAVNQLVIDMKAAGIWTAMKAVYPMVGASAAACAQNLKSSSFTGTFTSGWTFASTGATPNGTSAYMDTNLNSNTQLTTNNTHLSYYSRTNQYPYSGANVQVALGATISPSYLPLNSLELNGGTGSNNTFGVYMNDYNTGFVRGANTDTRGFLIGNRPSSNVLKLSFNGSIIASNTSTTSQALPNSTYYISALNLSNTAVLFCNAQTAFASIGDGLTDTQASNFYTCVQTFNTTLSRQV